MMIVCKFGGTALSDEENIRKIVRIIKNDSNRRFVVVSAMGKSFVHDKKVTDILNDCFYELNETGEMKSWEVVRKKYTRLADALDSTIDMRALLDETKEDILSNSYRDFILSRGEYLSAKLLSSLLNCKYIEAAEVMRFFCDGQFNFEESKRLLVQNTQSNTDIYVMAGFYGNDGSKIITFPRGGSDISGAIAAAALDAEIYENWTDVDGFFVADPSLVLTPALVPCLSYEQLRILSKLGARVLHCDSVLPVCTKNIPINIRNFYKPHLNGSLIVPFSAPKEKICGIVSEEAFKYTYTDNVNLPKKADVLFQSSSPKEKILISKNKLTASCFSGNFQVEHKCIVGVVFSNREGLAESVLKTLGEKKINTEILNCDRTLLLLLIDIKDRLPTIQSLNNLV